MFYASDHFEQLFQFAVELIKQGKAAVDGLTADEIRAHRGTLTEPGTNSPYRDRPIEENLDLFARMRAGEFEDGQHALRAKIDHGVAEHELARSGALSHSPGHPSPHGDAWCIYPMCDYAHPLPDALERITHSLCTPKKTIARCMTGVSRT